MTPKINVQSTKAVNVRMNESLHRQFKIYVTSKGMTMQDYIMELIKEKMKSENER